MKFYHYVHCPFCLRVRFVLGYLNHKYESHVLPYNDEQTPLSLCQKKMLPIVQFPDGTAMNESLDIIRKLDSKNRLKLESLETREFKDIENLLNSAGSYIHSLCMPYWVWTPEFDEESRKYFLAKKEQKRGPFNKLMQKKGALIRSLQPFLSEIEQDLAPFYKSRNMTIIDILIASHLWGMYILPEFQFSSRIDTYLQIIKETSNFEYHEDFWK